MKKIIIVSALVVVALFFMVEKKTGNNKILVDTYPWQITILPDGRSRVFGIVLDKTSLKEVDAILKSKPKMAIFEANNKLELEAYYKNVSLGGMIGSFIVTMNVPEQELNTIKKESRRKKGDESNSIRYELDKPTADKSKILIVKNLIYIPTVQLDDKIIIERFGKPAHKIKLKTKEIGWHYLYPEKGLDLIYKEEGKEVLQYVLPKNFNALLEPLQTQ